MEAISHKHVFFTNKYPHKSTNPTPSSSHICSNSPLIAILLQFLNVVPLPLITGKVPESMICSTLVFFSVCSQTSFYIFVNQIVCVDAKCTCVTHSVLHMVVIANDILKGILQSLSERFTPFTYICIIYWLCIVRLHKDR